MKQNQTLGELKNYLQTVKKVEQTLQNAIKNISNSPKSIPLDSSLIYFSEQARIDFLEEVGKALGSISYLISLLENYIGQLSQQTEQSESKYTT